MATRQKLGEYESKLRIRKGDLVKVIAGKDAGKSGKILRAFPKTNKVLVEGVNLMTKHAKAQATGRTNRQGVQEMTESGRIEKPAPLYAPKVMLICPSCNLPTRVGYAYREGEEKLARRKYRVCKHPECGKSID